MSSFTLEELNVLDKKYQKDFDLAIEEYTQTYDDIIAMEEAVAMIDLNNSIALESDEGKAILSRALKIADKYNTPSMEIHGVGADTAFKVNDKLKEYEAWDTINNDPVTTNSFMGVQNRKLKDDRAETGFHGDTIGDAWDKTGRGEVWTGVDVIHDAAYGLTEKYGSSIRSGITKASRWIGNLIGEKIKDIWYNLKDIKFDKIKQIQEGLKNDRYIHKEGTISESFYRKFSLFTSMGYDITNVNDVIEYLSKPYDLMVNKKIFRNFMPELAKNMLKLPPEQKSIQARETIDFIKKTDEKDIQAYVSAPFVVFALPNRLYATRLSVVRVTQNKDKGCVIDNKTFNMNSDDYLPKEPASTYKLEDTKKLVDACADLINKSKVLEYDEMKDVQKQVDGYIKSNKDKVSVKVDYKRLLKNIGLLVLGMKRAHLQGINIVEDLILKSVKKS